MEAVDDDFDLSQSEHHPPQQSFDQEDRFSGEQINNQVIQDNVSRRQVSCFVVSPHCFTCHYSLLFSLDFGFA
jgi:hypothetical protein